MRSAHGPRNTQLRMTSPLIAMAVHDTEENGRTAYTIRTLQESIYPTGIVPWVIDNGSCDETSRFLRQQERCGRINYVRLPENIGTAKAVNIGWTQRKKGQHAIKMDNDVVIHSETWVQEMADLINEVPTIGILGLKRIDLLERPDHPDPFYRSTIATSPSGVTIEYVNHVMGTCQMFNGALLDKIGYLYQPRMYGFDDSLAAVRSQVAGYSNAFMPHIRIDHIDTGATPYQGWKEKHAGEDMAEYNRLKDAYRNGSRSIFEPSTW